MGEELYKKYRPKTPSEFVGQEAALGIIKDLFKRNAVPHTLLLCGASGSGKTSAARMIKDRLGCTGIQNYVEMNCAEARGIDEIRVIDEMCAVPPMGGACRVWVMDECHKLTSDSMSALLKILEDTPKTAYFILCTTDPHKIPKTIRSRCTEIVFEPIPNDKLEVLIVTVLEREKATLSQIVVKAIVQEAQGSARKALVLLDTVIGLKDEQAQLKALKCADEEEVESYLPLCKLTMSTSPSWSQYQEIFRTLPKDPEGIRQSIKGYARKVLLGDWGDKNRAAYIIARLQNQEFEMSNIIAACYEIWGTK